MLSISGTICSSLIAPVNGDVTYSTPTGPFNFQATATYGCNDGYRHSGGDTVRTCVDSSSSSGVWTGIPATCESTYKLLQEQRYKI